MDPTVGDGNPRGQELRQGAASFLVLVVSTFLADDVALAKPAIGLAAGLLAWGAAADHFGRPGLSPVEAWARRPAAHLESVSARIWALALLAAVVGSAVAVARRPLGLTAYLIAPVLLAALVRTSQALAWTRFTSTPAPGAPGGPP